MIGKTLSHYTILEELGRGGMGIVYKAEDTKLGRTVAVKLLPTYAAVSEHDKIRFKREAQAAAAINHSCIATIYDFGETDDGEVYLAMEYIAGRTLSDIIEEGPLAIEKAISTTVLVAEGLQVAHEAGVVHRDIKSSNIMLTERGEVKIMDFGLAQMESASKLTQEGTTLGTIAYMSPEQARAETVDQRSDLWSLGVVLYEMIAGRTPFEGAYEQAIIYTILNMDPEPLTGIRTGVPMELERVVNKCLSKDAGLRYQHADDLIADLRAIDTTDLSGSRSRSVASIPAPSAVKEVSIRVPRFALPALVTIILVAVIVVWALSLNVSTPLLTVTGIELVSVEDDLVGFPDVHPDGDRIVYTVAQDGRSRIYYRQLSGGLPQVLLDKFDADQRFPKYSPDGQLVLFESEKTLYTVESLGGVPRPIAAGLPHEGWAFFNPAWSLDGTKIAFTSRVQQPDATGMDTLYVLDVASGSRSIVSSLSSVHSPSWSPDGTRLAVVSGNDDYLRRGLNIASSSIWMVSLENEQPVRITDNEFMDLSPVWSPDGSKIIFVSDRGRNHEIWEIRIGASGPIAEPRLISSTGKSFRSISLSKNGKFIVGEEVRGRQNIWMSRMEEGKTVSAASAIPVTSGSQIIESVVVSPDQSRIAYDSNIKGGFKIFVMDLHGAQARQEQQITFDDAQDYVYSWSPDGEELAFMSLRSGKRGLYTVRLSDRQISEVLVDSVSKYHPRWSADGKTIGFHRVTVNGRSLGLIHRLQDGTWGEEETLVPEGVQTTTMHPSENRIAYTTYRGLFVTGLDQHNPIPISVGTPRVLPWWPIWAPDGSKIYFSNSRSIWSIPSTGGEREHVWQPDGAVRGKGYFGVSDDALYYPLRETERDLWKLELSNAGSD